MKIRYSCICHNQMHVFKLIGFWYNMYYFFMYFVTHTHSMPPIIVTIGIRKIHNSRHWVGRKTLFALPKNVFGLVFYLILLHMLKVDKYGSISATIFEYTIPTMCKMWSNKNNTCQLKIPTKQLKANAAITCHTTRLNTFYLVHVTKQSHISHTIPGITDSPPPPLL